MFAILILTSIVLAGFIGKKFYNEYQLSRVRQTLVSEGFYSLFEPRLYSEGTAALQRRLQSLKELQIKINENLLAKYFVDCTHDIETNERLLQKRLENKDSQDHIVFSTMNFNFVTADPRYDSDVLIVIGEILDELFMKLEAAQGEYIEDSRCSYSVFLRFFDNIPNIEIQTSQIKNADDDLKEIFQDMTNIFSEVVFDSKPVKLSLEISSEDQIEPAVLEFKSEIQTKSTV